MIKKVITIEIKDGEVAMNIDGIENYTDILVALATFEGVVGGIMEIDKSVLRDAVDEVQKDLQAKLPKDLEVTV